MSRVLAVTVHDTSGRAPGRMLAVALCVLASMLLSSCVGLKTEGPVSQGLEIEGAAQDPVTVLPPGPAPGMNREEVIRGFLRAGTATQGDMSVARAYLTDELAKEWEPDAGTKILASGTKVAIKKAKGGAYQLTGNVVSTIDTTGRYSYAEPGSKVKAEVELVQEEGEWRIARLPDDFGRWIPESVMSRLFEPFNVYYVAEGSNALIPDVRWLPLDRQATRLMRAQLAPLPTYLEGAATNYLAAAVDLTADAVPVHAGVAEVDLSAVGLPSEPSARKNIVAQLVATLTQTRDVRAVAVTVEGAALDITENPGPVSSVRQLGMSMEPAPTQTDPVLRIDDTLLSVPPHRLLARPSVLAGLPPAFPPLPPGWERIAESRSGTEVAAVSEDGKELRRWRAEQVIEVPAFASDLTRPTYDRHDILWVGGVGTVDGDRAALWAINSAADPDDAERSAPRPIRAPWLAGRVVHVVKVSPDGQRVALVTSDPDGSHRRVQMSGIVRNPNGVPTHLSPAARELVPYLEGVRGLVWLSTTTVAVLGRLVDTKPITPWVVRIGGERHQLRPVEHATAITTTGGERGLSVITSDDKVFHHAGQTWIRAAGQDLAMPGR